MQTLRSIAPAARMGLACLFVACSDSPVAPNAGCAALPVAPAAQRVDLGRPVFSNPTSVTNPLFPIAGLERVILLGTADGLPLRVETTLMPRTVSLETHGQIVPTLESQYVAWLDGRLYEVALDWYAQDERGAVWYFGEDVFNYEAGVIVDTEGTWRAGSEGATAAMIMPADPQIGHVWRPENLCGVVFEEVIVQSVGVTVPGPAGSVAGAIVVEELHMDGARENKVFAPGYGEFSTGAAGGDLEAVALAVPTDALGGAVPAALVTLSAAADTVYAAARLADWSTATAAAGRVTAAWNAYRGGSVPPMLRDQGDSAVARLAAAVAATNAAASRQAALAVDQASLDLQLRHRPRAEIDLSLLGLWARQLVVHAEAGDAGAVQGDAATLAWIRSRLAEDVGPDVVAALGDVTRAAASRRLTEAAAAAGRLWSRLGT